MTTSIFHTAAALSDPDLLAQTRRFAQDEREATAELVAHLAVLEMRPAAYAALGHGSLFGYCTEVLRLSEDAACTRIGVARLCRQFPLIADLMASGSINLTTARLIGPHLTPENHEAVLGRAANQGRTEIQALVAELAPQPDVPASLRKLPGAPAAPRTTAPEGSGVGGASGPAPESILVPVLATATAGTARRAVVQASAPDRFRVQFTIGRQAHDELRRVQALLRREVPDGDAGTIFERALHLLLEQVEKEKLGTGRTRRAIRPGTDESPAAGVAPQRAADRPADGERAAPTAPRRSRHVPKAVRQAVWTRDGARCAFVGPSGVRCGERSFLEFHHVRPFAHQGPATIENIALRCRRHNQHEGELVFGPRLREKEGDGAVP